MTSALEEGRGSWRTKLWRLRENADSRRGKKVGKLCGRGRHQWKSPNGAEQRRRQLLLLPRRRCSCDDDHRYHHPITHSALSPHCGRATKKPTRIPLPPWLSFLEQGSVSRLATLRHPLSPAAAASPPLRFVNNAQDGFLTVSYARKFNAPTWETRHGGRQAEAARRPEATQRGGGRRRQQR